MPSWTKLAAFLSLTLAAASAQKIVISNDDGWATAQIRAQTDALLDAGFEVILSAPADNRSGSGSNSAPATPLTKPCQFDTCPTGSPAQGFNASDPRLNYVNAFPVDSARYGIQTLAPKLWGAPPDFVVAGPNIGHNLGTVVLGSGTVGAAVEAVLEGIPSTAFSAVSGSPVSYTTLESDPSASSTISARIAAKLAADFTRALLASDARPVLPPGVTVNVNVGSTSPAGCKTADAFRFVFTRNVAAPSGAPPDAEACGSTRLSDENTVVRSASGCFVSVSVLNVTTKADTDAASQAAVLARLQDTLPLTCFSG